MYVWNKNLTHDIFSLLRLLVYFKLEAYQFGDEIISPEQLLEGFPIHTLQYIHTYIVIISILHVCMYVGQRQLQRQRKALQGKMKRAAFKDFVTTATLNKPGMYVCMYVCMNCSMNMCTLGVGTALSGGSIHTSTSQPPAALSGEIERKLSTFGSKWTKVVMYTHIYIYYILPFMYLCMYVCRFIAR